MSDNASLYGGYLSKPRYIGSYNLVNVYFFLNSLELTTLWIYGGSSLTEMKKKPVNVLTKTEQNPYVPSWVLSSTLFNIMTNSCIFLTCFTFSIMYWYNVVHSNCTLCSCLLYHYLWGLEGVLHFYSVRMTSSYTNLF